MKKKKVLKISAIFVVAILLIAFCSVTGVVYSIDLTSNTDFLQNNYATSSDVVFSVASYNVKGGNTTKENLSKINSQIASYNIDIAGLQEIDSDNSPRSKNNKCITTLTSEIYNNYYFAPTKSLVLKDNYGIMSISKHKLNEKNTMYLPMPNRYFMLKGEPRVVTRTIINISGCNIAFYNTHLSYENNVKIDGEEMRIKQLKYILSIMDKDKCPNKVLVGDFNLLSFDEIAMFNANYNMVNNINTNYVSYRGDDCTFKCLDNIIFSKNITLVESEMIDNDLSDHNMLYAKLKIA